MYIKVSSVCSENPTRSCSPTVLDKKKKKIKPPQPLLLLVPSESCVRFSLKTFQAQKKKPRSSGSLALCAPPPPLPPAGLDCGRRRKECSYSSHSHLWSVCLLSSPCCVAHDEPCSHFAVFCCELSGTFLLFLKTGDVFMSLIWVPLWPRLPAAMLVLYVDLE